MSASLGFETPPRLRHFVEALDALLGQGLELDETRIVARGSELLRELVAHDDWLPQQAALPDPQYYRQYLLYRDPAARFSVVSFVWGPGQSTPIHNHTV
ncbi:MAG TPA: cysteine dioxygenase, partial [Duganella sp.]